MSLIELAALVGAALLVVATIVIYNTLIRKRQRAEESWSNVDTELQRRYDLIPNLIRTVQGYMEHERSLLEEIVTLREHAEGARSTAASHERIRMEQQLSDALSRLSMRFEQYPQLQASTHFRALQGELANTEDRVQAALRFYNGNVRELNVSVQAFPSSLVARMFGFSQRAYFELRSLAARDVPDVRF
ncbi:MAG: LemA family protein [Myxococcota bacterium]